MNRDRLYLLHISECISRVEVYVAQGQASFVDSTLIQDAVIRNLQTLGESARNLSEQIRSSHPDVDWRGIMGFRNVVVHDYLGVNLVRVWEVVELHLPALKTQVEAMLSEPGQEQ